MTRLHYHEIPCATVPVFDRECGTFQPRCWEHLTFAQQSAVLDAIEGIAETVANGRYAYQPHRCTSLQEQRRFEQAKARLRALVLQCTIDEADFWRGLEPDEGRE